jgi:hypothetical protein
MDENNPENGLKILRQICSINMSYFAVNNTRKQIYKLAHRMESFFEVLEFNPLWRERDDIVFVDNDVDPLIGSYMKMDYTTNLDVLEIPLYLNDPEHIVWYMDAHAFRLADICRAITVWEGTEKKKMAEDALEDMLEWKEEQSRMHGYEEPNDEEEMLCHALDRAM